MADTAKLKVMIVDDDAVNRELLQTVFQRNGYQVVQTSSGATALGLATREQPNIILSDVRMQGMSGYEVCAQLKASPDTAHIPVIILTAHDDDVERQKAWDAGASDFIPKMRGWVPLLERVKALTQV
jgi:two-component system, cell cycle response regulator